MRQCAALRRIEEKDIGRATAAHEECPAEGPDAGVLPRVGWTAVLVTKCTEHEMSLGRSDGHSGAARLSDGLDVTDLSGPPIQLKVLLTFEPARGLHRQPVIRGGYRFERFDVSLWVIHKIEPVILHHICLDAEWVHYACGSRQVLVEPFKP